jgi:hypothetical protein
VKKRRTRVKPPKTKRLKQNASNKTPQTKRLKQNARIVLTRLRAF